MTEELFRYMERVALHFESGGLPRIAGRILAWLIVADPPEASVTELSDRLSISMGSASTMTRLLASTGLVEKAPVPGSRQTFYRLSTDGFEEAFEFKLRQLASFRQLADDGLNLMLAAPPERRRRLATLHALHAFYEDEFPALTDKWRQQREARIAAVIAASSDSEEEE